MNIKFFLSDRGRTSRQIRVRVYHNRFDRTAGTGLFSLVNGFNRKKGRAIHSNAINAKLSEIEASIHTFLEGKRLDTLPKNWLKNLIGNMTPSHNDSKYFSDWIETYINDKKLVSDSTKQSYRTALKRIKEYEGAHQYSFIDIDELYCNGLIQSVSHLSTNTIGTFLTVFKMFCAEAQRQGKRVPNDYLTIKPPSRKSVPIYLTEDEIMAIVNLRCDKPHIENVRRLMIIGLRTGLRFSDFSRLTSGNIDGDFIVITTKKTNQPVHIPIHPDVRAIIETGVPTASNTHRFNLRAKEVCRLAGIDNPVKINKCIDGNDTIVEVPKWQAISSHVCRRSFASNLYGKVSTTTIMAVTGHCTETSLMKYIGRPNKELVNEIKQYWHGT